MQYAPISDTDFQAAADSQEESLEVEFKRSLDLASKEGRSKLAKEICALCNFGGGWIVFGRDDNGDIVEALPDEIEAVDQDAINQISATYLTPSPHCTLRWVRREGMEFDLPVIWVPSVGSEPVCAGKNGPQDAKGRIVGVQLGTHYTRSAGPVSARISSPDQWKDVIRRCVLSDKTQLFGALSVMMSQPKSRYDDQPSTLDVDFDFLINMWAEQISAAENRNDLSENFLAFGFDLVGSSEQIELTTDQIKAALSSRSTSHNGPRRFFEDRYPGDAAPYVFENAGQDGLQADFIKGHDGIIDDMPAIWRISEAGVGVEVFSYWEDTSWLKSAVEGKSSRKWEQGKNIWIAVQMENVAGFMTTVWEFAQKVGFQGQVRLRASYFGLAGRQLNSPRSSMAHIRQYISKKNQKTVDLSFELAALEETVRSSAVASVVQQLNKLFQGPIIDTEGVVRTLEAHRRG